MQYDNTSFVLSHILLLHKPPSLTTPSSPKVRLEYHVVYRIYSALLNSWSTLNLVMSPIGATCHQSSITSWIVGQMPQVRLLGC